MSEDIHETIGQDILFLAEDAEKDIEIAQLGKRDEARAVCLEGMFRAYRFSETEYGKRIKQSTKGMIEICRIWGVFTDSEADVLHNLLMII